MIHSFRACITNSYFGNNKRKQYEIITVRHGGKHFTYIIYSSKQPIKIDVVPISQMGKI